MSIWFCGRKKWLYACISSTTTMKVLV